MLRHYDLVTLTVTVTGPSEVHDRIARYFPITERASSITINLKRVGPNRLQKRLGVITGRAPDRVASGHPDVIYDVWDGHPDGIHFVPQTDLPHLLTVKEDPDAGATLLEVFCTDLRHLGRTGVRLMRQLLLRVGESDTIGGIGGHGAALVKDDRALIVAGPPGAGKTTITLTLAAHGGFDLIGSDKLAVVPDGDVWSVIGIPVPWRIAAGTIRAVRKLHLEFQRGVSFYRDDDFVEGKWQFMTHELEGFLNVGSTLSAPLETIVVLVRDEPRRGEVRVLQGDTKVQALHDTLFKPEDQIFNTDWLGLTEMPSASQQAARVEQLAQSTRVIEASYWPDEETLSALAEELVRMIGQAA